jgi:hypothetical protein
MEIESMIRKTPSPDFLRADVKKCKNADEIFSVLKMVDPYCIKAAENHLGHSCLVAEGQKNEVRIIGDVDIVPEQDISNYMVGQAGEVVIRKYHDAPCHELLFDPKRNYKDELIRSSAETISPEYFYEKKCICNSEVIISLGRVGFTEQAIKKIGFDPVKYLQDQNKRICELTTACNQIKQQLKTVSADNEKIKSELEEEKKPLIKKFFNFISGKFNE